MSPGETLLDEIRAVLADESIPLAERRRFAGAMRTILQQMLAPSARDDNSGDGAPSARDDNSGDDSASDDGAPSARDDNSGDDSASDSASADSAGDDSASDDDGDSASDDGDGANAGGASNIGYAEMLKYLFTGWWVHYWHERGESDTGNNDGPPEQTWTNRRHST